jgi:hypothetical protein
MKTKSLLLGGALCGLVLVAARAVEPAAGTASRVGIYDSRAVSFAHFWSEPARQERDALIAKAKAAKDSGDKKRFEELQKEIVAGQKRSHLQVFSTAPADEAMAALQDKLPAIERELGVTSLVSKWDEGALKTIPEANRVDATDRLVREFKLDEKRRNGIEKFKTVKPLPLWQAKLLILFSGL